MEKSPLKQRLIGAIVLVALAVILVPMLLTGERRDAGPLFGTNIPPEPRAVKELKVLEFEEQVPPQPSAPAQRTLVDKASPPEVTQAPPPGDTGKAAAPPAAKQETAEAAAASGPHAWAVQAGSFSQSEKATRLRDRLRKQGYRAFVEAVNTADGKFFRVRVGPEVRREAAEALQKDINRKMKIKSMVVRHP